MFNKIKNTVTVLCIGAALAVIAKRFLHIDCAITRDAEEETKERKNKKEKALQGSCNNIFEGTFQPAFFNINVSVNSDNKK